MSTIKQALAHHEKAPTGQAVTAWKPPKKLDWDTWEIELNRLLLAQEALPWLIGDCLLVGEKRFGENYTQALPTDKYALQTLLNYRWVASRFEPSRRRETLRFALHAEVASLEPEEQDRWLDRAAEEGWTRQALRDARRAVDVTPGAHQPGGEGEAVEAEGTILAADPDAAPTSPAYQAEYSREGWIKAVRDLWFMGKPAWRGELLHELIESDTEALAPKPFDEDKHNAQVKAQHEKFSKQAGKGDPQTPSTPAEPPPVASDEAADSAGQESRAKSPDEAGSAEPPGRGAGRAAPPAEDDGESRASPGAGTGAPSPEPEYEDPFEPKAVHAHGADCDLCIPPLFKRTQQC